VHVPTHRFESEVNYWQLASTAKLTVAQGSVVENAGAQFLDRGYDSLRILEN